MTWEKLIERPDLSDSEPFRRPTQARGEAKFEQILDAAHELAEEKGVGEFGLRDVAKRAQVATGSVYHFFPNNETLFVALVERYDKAFVKLVSEPVDSADVESWEDVVSIHFERARLFINDNPPATTLIIGSGRSWQSRQADTVGDADIAAAIAHSLNELFEMPSLPPPEEILHIGIRILEGLWELSVQQHGRVTDAFSRETTRAVNAYLGLYWSRYLERRD
jgi:AcrR family transcriptional regulator